MNSSFSFLSKDRQVPIYIRHQAHLIDAHDEVHEYLLEVLARKVADAGIFGMGEGQHLPIFGEPPKVLGDGAHALFGHCFLQDDRAWLELPRRHLLPH